MLSTHQVFHVPAKNSTVRLVTETPTLGTNFQLSYFFANWGPTYSNIRAYVGHYHSSHHGEEGDILQRHYKDTWEDPASYRTIENNGLPPVKMPLGIPCMKKEKTEALVPDRGRTCLTVKDFLWFWQLIRSLCKTDPIWDDESMAWYHTLTRTA